MSNPNPRKRAAPGAVPTVPMQQQPYPTPGLTADQMVRWSGVDNAGGYTDPSAASGDQYELVHNQPQYPQNIATPANSLTRRPTNRGVVSNFDPSWYIGMGNEGALVPHNHAGKTSDDDNLEELEERAQKAKREAQAKRKHIPPFVQKLSSFLEEGKNEDLIRWSEKGDSFIVLDEEEFAKTLIPELFKHNNYASFVRQLNMYGFHKRVGLSDNSMRASERKNKSPSEYSNPYFRRGHPNLLWLINKPRSGSSKGKDQQKGTEEAEDHGDAGHDDASGQGQGASNARKSLPPAGDTPIHGKDLTLIRDELKQVREHQKLISRTIAQLQQNNRELYNQALMFQTQHDRHQNSINAILHFLANLFRKSLEEQGNSQPNIGDILSSMLANQGQQPAQQGNVVDLGDFFHNNDSAAPQLPGTPHRKARGLLPPIPAQAASSSRSSRTGRSPSTVPSQYYYSGNQNHETGQVTELVDGSNADTPPNLRQELENNPQEQMMRIIHDHNASTSPGVDIPNAADFVTNTPNNLNQDQRNQLANFMSRQSTTPTARRQSSVPPNPPPTTNNHAPQSTTAVSPSVGTGPDNSTAPSLSPIMRSPAMPPLSVDQISSNQSELERLQELQQQQDARIQELNDMLGPLSPSGRIPELDGTGGETYFDPQNVDLDQYFDSNAFINDGGAFDGTGGDFNFDGTNNNAFDTGQVDGFENKVATGNTPSEAGTEEIFRDDLENDGNAGHNKRRRVG